MFISCLSCKNDKATDAKIEKLSYKQQCALVTDLVLATILLLGGIFATLQGGSGINSFTMSGASFLVAGTILFVADFVKFVKFKLDSLEKLAQNNLDSDAIKIDDRKAVSTVTEKLSKMEESQNKKIDQQSQTIAQLSSIVGQMVSSEGLKKINAEYRADTILKMPYSTYEEKLALIATYEKLYPDVLYYKQSRSKQLRGLDSPIVEYRKTINSFFCLLFIKHKDYDAFVEARLKANEALQQQKKPPVPLITKVHFLRICIKFDKAYPGLEGFDVACNINGFHDIYKLEDVKKASGSADEREHDDDLSDNLNKHNPIIRGFHAMTMRYQELSKKMWKTGFLGPQMVQGESTYDDLIEITRMRKGADPDDLLALEMMELQEIWDIMGAFANPINDSKSPYDKQPAYNGSITFDENNFMNFEMMIETFEKQIDFNNDLEVTATEMYLKYYQKRGADLGIHLDINKVDPKALTAIRVGCALRKNGPDDGKKIMELITKFEKEHGADYKKLTESFMQNSVKMMYMPSFLQSMEGKDKTMEGLCMLADFFTQCEDTGAIKQKGQKAPTVSLANVVNHLGTIKNPEDWKFKATLEKGKTTFQVTK